MEYVSGSSRCANQEGMGENVVDKKGLVERCSNRLSESSMMERATDSIPPNSSGPKGAGRFEMTDRMDHCAHDCGETCSIEFFRPSWLQVAVHYLLRELLPLVLSMGAFLLIGYAAVSNYKLTDMALTALLVTPILPLFLYRLTFFMSYNRLKRECKEKVAKARAALERRFEYQQTELERKHLALSDKLSAEKRAFSKRVSTVMAWLDHEKSRKDASLLALELHQHLNGLVPNISGSFVTDREMEKLHKQIEQLKEALVAERKLGSELEEAFNVNRRTLALADESRALRETQERELAELLKEWIKQIYQSKDSSNQPQVLRNLRMEMVKYVHTVWGPDSEAWRCLDYLGATEGVEIKADEEAS